MYNDMSWRIFCFFSGAILMQLFMIWLHANSSPVLEKKQNDAILAACEQELPRNKHCVLIAVREDDVK